MLFFGLLGGQGGTDNTSSISKGNDNTKEDDLGKGQETEEAEQAEKIAQKEESDEVKDTKEIKDVYLMGEIAELKDINIQVTNLERSQGPDIDKPKTGYEYDIVTVAIKNISDKVQSYNVYNFSLKNSNGQIEDEAFSTIANDTALGSGDIAPGGMVTGSIIFETPVGDSGLKLLYGDNIFSDKDIVFDLCNSIGSFEVMQGEKVNIDSSLPGIGDVVKFKNMNVTVERIEYSSGDDWNQPDAGEEYVIVYITLENTGSDTEAYNPFDFKLQNSTGNRVDQSFTSIDSDTAMASGELAAGGKFTSIVTFEVPIGDKELGLIYEPN